MYNGELSGQRSGNKRFSPQENLAENHWQPSVIDPSNFIKQSCFTDVINNFISLASRSNNLAKTRVEEVNEKL